MLKVALAGAQDTGKTTVARMLSGRLSSRGILTHYVQEFARGYIPKAGEITSLAEELFLVEQQLKLERETPAGMAVMITDSPVFLAFVYSILMVNFRQLHKKDIIMLDRVYDKVLDHGGYDMIFLLPVRCEPADDGVRPESLRRKNGDIAARVGAFITLHGLVAQKLTTVLQNKSKAFNAYTDSAEQTILAILRGLDAAAKD